MLDSMKKIGSKLDDKGRAAATPSPIGFVEAQTILRQPQQRVKTEMKENQ